MPLVPKMAYQARDSIIHRLHPITKLVFLVSYCILVLVLNNFVLTLLLFGLILILMRAAKIPFTYFARRARFIIMFSLVLFIAQLIFVKSGRVLFPLIPSSVPIIGGAIQITTGGIEGGIMMAFRFLCIITSSFLFVAATHPNDLAYALMQIGLPYRYGFMLITTLRFLPLFGSEFSVVRKAQIARGMETSIKPREIMRTVRMTFVPLLVSAMSKVDALSISMEGRGFGLNRNRTFVRKLAFRNVDKTLTIGIMLITVAIVLLVVYSGIPMDFHL